MHISLFLCINHLKMKLFTVLLVPLLSQAVYAHCKSASPTTLTPIDCSVDIWTTLVTGGGTSSSAAIRMPVSNSPVQDVTSNDIICNANPGVATETVSVAAGSTVGFLLDNTLYHQGPAAIYLGKAPSTAATWDGSGANWFKACMILVSTDSR